MLKKKKSNVSSGSCFIATISIVGIFRVKNVFFFFFLNSIFKLYKKVRHASRETNAGQ